MQFFQMIGIVLMAISSLAAQSLDKIVAIVNEEVITAQEVQTQAAKIKSQLQQSEQLVPDQDVLNEQVLAQLIDLEVQLQRAKALELEVSAAELTTAINNIATRNKVDLPGLKKMIAEQSMTFADYQQGLRKEIMLAKLHELEVGRKIVVTEQQIKHYLQQQQQANTVYQLEDLHVVVEEGASEVTRQQAERLAQQLLKQANHQALATLATDQRVTFNDLGWRKQADIPKVFVKALATLQAQQVAGPIKTANGFHLLKLVAIEQSKPLTHEQVRQLLYQQQYEQRLADWLKDLRAAAYIKTVH